MGSALMVMRRVSGSGAPDSGAASCSGEGGASKSSSRRFLAAKAAAAEGPAGGGRGREARANCARAHGGCLLPSQLSQLTLMLRNKVHMSCECAGPPGWAPWLGPLAGPPSIAALPDVTAGASLASRALPPLTRPSSLRLPLVPLPRLVSDSGPPDRWLAVTML